MRLASDAARESNGACIDTEHLLLGLAKEGGGIAARILKGVGADLDRLRIETDKLAKGSPTSVSARKQPDSEQLKQVIAYSIEEARSLNHNYVGTEHLLLGLLREQEGVAAQVLANLGLKPDDVRQEVLNLVGHGLGHEENPSRFNTTLGPLAGLAIAAAVAWTLHASSRLTWWFAVPLGLLVPWSIPILIFTLKRLFHRQDANR